MKTKKQNKTPLDAEAILEEALKRVKNSKKNKVKKMSTGGPFNPEDEFLTPDQKNALQLSGEDEQTAILKEASVAAKKDTTSKTDTPITVEISEQGDTNMLSSIPVVGTIISAIGGILDEVSGEVDPETGRSDSQAQAGMQGMANSASFSNVTTGIEEIGEGDIGQGLMNIFSPWAGEMMNQDVNAKQLREDKANKLISDATTKTYKEKQFTKDGGVIRNPKKKTTVLDQEPPQTNYNQLIDSNTNPLPLYEGEGKENIDALNPYDLVQQGMTSDGKPHYGWVEKPDKKKTTFIPGEGRPINETIVKNYAIDELGMEVETVNQMIKENPQLAYDTIINTAKEKYDKGESKRQIISKTDDKGKNSYYEIIPNKNKKEVSDYDDKSKKVQKKADGGEVVGSGTGRSDSIDAKIPPGSFIVPADANKEIVNRIKKYMDYDKAKVKSGPGAEVKLSDGELYIPPQDVEKVNNFVKMMGFNEGLNELAPNAKTKLQEGMGYKDGLQNAWDWTADEGLPYLQDNAGYIAGAAQLGYGLIEAFNKDEEPVSRTPQLLKQLSNEVRKRANYGLDPYERTQAENFIAKNLIQEKELAREVSNGSVDAYLNNAIGASIRSNQAKIGLEAESSKIAEGKRQYADSMELKYIDSMAVEDDRKYKKYLDNEDAIAEIINAGISNVIGKTESDQYSEGLRKSNMTPEQIAAEEQAEKDARQKARDERRKKKDTQITQQSEEQKKYNYTKRDPWDK